MNDLSLALFCLMCFLVFVLTICKMLGINITTETIKNAGKFFVRATKFVAVIIVAIIIGIIFLLIYGIDGRSKK